MSRHGMEGLDIGSGHRNTDDIKQNADQNNDQQNEKCRDKPGLPQQYIGYGGKYRRNHHGRQEDRNDPLYIDFLF